MNNTKGMPEGFLWGAASSSFQIEGYGEDSGRGQSIIDNYPKQEGVSDTSVAAGHYERYKEDVALMKEQGLKSYHFSIAWSRVIPDGNGAVNEKGVEFYSNLIDELLDAGIEPIVTAYHFDMPQKLIDEYNGWHSRRIIDDYANYIRVLLTHLGDRVNYWILLGGMNLETFYPRFNGGCDNPDNIEEWRYRIAHIKFLASAKAIKLCRQMCPHAKVGSALDYNINYSATCKPEDRLALFNRNMHYAFFYYDVLINGKYPPLMKRWLENRGIAPHFEPGDAEVLADSKPDFISLYYYESTTVQYAPETAERQEMEYNRSVEGKKGGRQLPTFPGLYKVCENNELTTTDWDWPIDPLGFRLSLLELYDRYELPIIVGENGLGLIETPDENGYVEDDARIDYLKQHIVEMEKAYEAGVDIISYNVWSNIDVVSTSNGFSKRYGFVRVNREETEIGDLMRIPKKSFYWYQNVINSNGRQL